DGVVYRLEKSRGYDFVGSLWSPGHFTVQLTRDRPVSFVASMEPWQVMRVLDSAQAIRSELERRRRMLAIAPPATTSDAAAELVLAADQFLITPVGRHLDGAVARSVGDEVRTVIAGYHW